MNMKKALMTAALLLIVLTALAAAPRPEEMPSSGPVTIELWSSLSGAKAKLFDEQVAAYHASQADVIVNVIHQGGYSVLRQKVAAAANAGNMPAVLIVDYLDVAWYAQLSLIKPLDNVLPAAVIQDYYPSMLADMRYEGSLYGIPYNRSTQGFFVNNELIARAGLPGPAKTWAEFKAASEQIKSLGQDYYYGYAFFHQFLFDAIAYTWGADISTPDGTVRLNSPEMIAMFTYFQNLYQDGLLLMQPVLLGGFEEQNGAFLDGKVATVFQTTSFFPTAQNLLKNYDWSFEFIPAGAGGHAVTIGGGNFSITSKATKAETEAAGKFLSYMSSPEIVAEFFMGTGNLPTRKAAMNLPDVKAYLASNPSAARMIAQLDYGKAAPSQTKNIRNIFNRVNDLISLIILKGEDPEKVLDDYTAEFQREFDEAKANDEFIY